MNKYFKIFKKLFLFSTLLLIAFYLFLLNSYKFVYTEDEVNSFANEINNSPNLPNEFYELYNKEFDNSLEKSTIKYLTKSIYKLDLNRPVSIWTAKIFQIKNNKATTFDKFFKLENSLAIKIESLTNSKQQLNWLMENCEFGYNQIGIQNASKFFFKKELKQLNKTEIATLVVMTRNPNLYNPLRRPEKVNDKVRLLLKEQ